ncbi:hypothetical protein IWZ00DRAFT_485587 [Phyllosticta capitalensis]
MPPRLTTPSPPSSPYTFSPPPAPRRARHLQPQNRNKNVLHHRRYNSLDSITTRPVYGWEQEQDPTMDAMVLDSEEDDLMAYDGSDEDESDETSENGDQMDTDQRSGTLSNKSQNKLCLVRGDYSAPPQPAISSLLTTTARQPFTAPLDNMEAPMDTDMGWKNDVSHSPMPSTPRLAKVMPVPFSSPPVFPESSPVVPATTFGTMVHLPQAQQQQTKHHPYPDAQMMGPTTLFRSYNRTTSLDDAPSSVYSSDGFLNSSPAGFGIASLRSSYTIPSSPIQLTSGVKRPLIEEEGADGKGTKQEKKTKKAKMGMEGA